MYLIILIEIINKIGKDKQKKIFFVNEDITNLTIKFWKVTKT